MRYAIFSDVHANWQAWNVVRDDILSRDVDAIVCLGDIIGYGPSPIQVLDDVLKNCNNIVVGNHDAAVSGRFDLDLFADVPRMAAEWTIEQLDENRLAILRDLPEMIEDDYVAFAHAETHAPEEYGYVSDTDDALACLNASEKQIIFVGHTHIPAIFVQTPDGTVHLLDQTHVAIDDDCRYLVNVGSVGDPRDGTKFASHCICDLDEGYIQLHKTPFDIETHYQEILQYPRLALPHFLADRATNERPVVRAQQAIRVKKASRMKVHAARARAIQRRAGILSASTVSAITRGQTTAGTQLGLEGELSPLIDKKNPMIIILVAAAVATLVIMAVALGLVVYMMDDGKKKSPPGQNIGATPPPPKPGVMKVKGMSNDMVKNARPQLSEDTIIPDDNGILRLSLDKVNMSAGSWKKEWKGDIQCIGCWFDSSARAIWKVWVDTPGEYDIRIRYALEKATGHKIYVGCGSKFLTAPVGPTGGWDQFVGKSVGRIQIKRGLNRLVIKAEQKSRRSGFMNLAAVRLTPARIIDAPPQTDVPGDTGAEERAAADNDGSTKTVPEGDFELINAKLTPEGTGYRFEAEDKTYAFAVRKTPKPMYRATFTFNARISPGGQGRYTNVFLVLGTAADPGKLIKCRVHLGKKSLLAVEGHGSKALENKIENWSGTRTPVRVEVDTEGKSIRLTACGMTIARKIARGDIPAITFYGYGCHNASSFVSPIRILGRNGDEFGTVPTGSPLSVVAAKASSSEEPQGHTPDKAIDQDLNSRWCAINGSCPQWLQLDLGEPKMLNTVKIMWEKEDAVYGYRISISRDGATWYEAVNKTANNAPVRYSKEAVEAIARLVRITITKLPAPGVWASIKEVKLEGCPVP